MLYSSEKTSGTQTGIGTDTANVVMVCNKSGKVQEISKYSDLTWKIVVFF